MPGLIIDKVGGGSSSNPNVYVESNYSELKALKEEGKLVPGQKYLLQGYQHKYMIAGSDTSPIQEEGFVDSLAYNYYHAFDSGVRLPIDSIVTVSYLPPSYTGNVQIGDKFEVHAMYTGAGDHYIPGLPKVIGLGVTYEVAFYDDPNINNQTIKERFYSALTGTINSAADTNTITGVGTVFSQELEPGDHISYFVDAGNRFDSVVESIVSDTELTVKKVALAEDVATGAAVEKLTFGKVVMRPGGLINTDVHNGTAYSGMVAEENQAPPFESLILTAFSKENFSRTAESNTFPGDVVEYDFDDTSIFDNLSSI